VCCFFGRDVYKELNGEVPIGLVASDWGGQAIQVFSSPDALNDTTCGGTNISSAPLAEAAGSLLHAGNGGGGDGVTNSQLWFAMLAPFVNMRFAGAVWYQVGLIFCLCPPWSVLALMILLSV
jgi:sialate O-acetylesterase